MLKYIQTQKWKEGDYDMDKRYDVTAMGEMLIDFTMNGQSEQGIIHITT